MGLLLTFNLPAQSAATASFSSSSTTHYKGRIDDLNDVIISLKCLNKKCEGELVYLRSKDRLDLKGSREGNVLDLKELDEDKQVTGYLSGKIEGKQLIVDWENNNRSIGSSITLSQVERKPEFPSYCGNNKWIHAYRGVIKDEEVEMILQKVDNQRILGHIFIPDSKKSWLVNGSLSENNNLQLNLVDEANSKPVGLLRAIYKNDTEISASFYNADNLQSFASFELKKSLGVSCLEYADYFTSYDFLFPKSHNALFNEMMTLLVQDWLVDCRDHTQKMRTQSTTPDRRASQRAYAWSDIEGLNDDYISGLLTYYSTWSGKKESKAFNFDFKSKQNLMLGDIFKRDFDYQVFIQKMIGEEIRKNPYYQNDRGFRDWIKTESFKHFTINGNGLAFFTDFHIVYGRQKIVVPYKKLKSNIRKNSPLRELF